MLAGGSSEGIAYAGKLVEAQLVVQKICIQSPLFAPAKPSSGSSSKGLEVHFKEEHCCWLLDGNPENETRDIHQLRL